jgi:putative flippase GtrA
MFARTTTVGRFARFTAMGAIGFSLNIAATVSLHEGLGAPVELAFAVALVVVFALSFFAGRYLIFEGAARGNPKKQLGKFVFWNAGFRLAEYTGFLVLHTILDMPYLLTIVAVLGASFLTKYVTYSNVVFVDDREVS